MRPINQVLNLSRIFDCFSRRFNKVVFNLKLSNLVDSHVFHVFHVSCLSFGNEKNYRLEHHFPANFLCRMVKRRPSTALGLVSQLFRSCSYYPLKFQMPDVNWLFLHAPHSQNLKYAIFFNPIMKSCHSNKKT